jgi:DNA-binding response OmpR family regulator
MYSILIIEDDLCLGKSLQTLFTKRNCTAKLCTNISNSYKFLEKKNPDLVIADRVLPDGDGIEIVEYLKDYSYKTKVLMLSKKSEVENRVEGLANGADDYLAKPFSSKELILRVDSLLNKDKLSSIEFIEIGNLKLFYTNGNFMIEKISIPIRKREIDLLHCLMIHHGQVVSRHQLINWVWGCNSNLPTLSTIDVYITRLREKLGPHKKYLKTVRGFGYQLKLPAD